MSTCVDDPSAVTDCSVSKETLGFADSPAVWLEAAFTRVAHNDMQTLPFYRAAIPVKTCGFTLFEQQWVGCLLTPWTLSLLVLPGPDQVWSQRTTGERLALQLPCGNVTFMVSDIADASGQNHQYLSCSLMSPIDPHMSAQQALTLAEQSARMALSLPVVDANAPRNLSRRALFLRGNA